MKHILILLAMVFSTSSHACGDAPSRTYTFVYILTGPATDLDKDAQSQAFAGHFANMKRLTKEGSLLLAGPYGAPNSDESLRGLWVFATDKIDEALELAATDPTGQLGIFAFDAVQLETDDKLIELPRLKKEHETRRLNDPAPKDEFDGRVYMIATAPVSTCDEPKRTKNVFMLATLIGHEGSRIEEDHWIMLLDATTPEEAKSALIEAECDPESWMLDLWYETKMPAMLPSLRD